MTVQDKKSNDWKFYGRRIGRKLSPTRQSALDDLMPLIGIPEKQITSQGNLDPSSLFSTPFKKMIFEIGFGNGERLVEDIKRHPDHAFIGAEPFINGLSAFMRDIQKQKTTENIRIYGDDAIPLAKSLTSKSLDAIYVLNPDPWHKTRHFKRRIINQDNLEDFARILKTGGDLIMTTDNEPLAEWMVTQATMHPAFTWTAQRADDWRTAPEGWIPTRYETKRAKGAGKMNYLFFRKASSD